MITFKAVEPDGSIGIDRGTSGEFSVSVIDFNSGSGANLPVSDAPAIALAILEAAGHDVASSSSCLMQAFDLIEMHVKEAAARAEAQEALRNKRRDELAKEFSELTDNKYEIIGMFGRKAIDRIIDLEESQK